MATPTTTTNEATTDSLLNILADDFRRQTLRVLWDRDDAISLDRLVTALASRAQTGGVSLPSDPEHIRTVLYHKHLPRLAEAGLIAYVESDEQIRLLFTAEPETKDLLSDLLATEET